MRFLADESFDFRVVTALRAAGHDVLAVLEEAPGALDPVVLRRARRTRRILLTEDRDFGRLVFATSRPSAGGGVLLVRCPEAARAHLPERIIEAIARAGPRLEGRFAVWTPGRVRIR
ncbi:MAG TPA: DUF5615 family PIN-like protein [Planctomycetota bacterium]